MTIQHVAVPNGAIPPVPAGATATVHSRDLPPQAVPMQTPPQPDPLAALNLPQAQQPQVPAQQPQPQPAPTGVDPQLLSLLEGMLAANQPAAAAPPPAPVPVAPQGDGLEGALRGVLAASGIDVDRAVANALKYGNSALIDVQYLVEKGGANAAHLTQVARSLVESAIAEDARSTAILHARAGGEANFNAAVSAFNSSAPEQVKMVVKALVDSGNDQSVLAGVDLMMQYTRGATVTNPGLVQAGAGATIASGLSREDFQSELQKLDRYSPQYETQRQELFARRAYGKHSGL